ncbi:DUF3558 domain-containing protein [Mycobacterium sp. CBMA271]|uniref:DUF3558 domain-containing protein n=2 Tax=unclassified Mycobacteroides TaxID=2618759 RepID=UPI0012DDD507|nr:DUF3558 domain-containing protein [Mycobacteroides sp. CBMA 271]MUM23977.1 DUF3558 domain-containing protein [Mycobacteroides sp. CBMA 271]
MGLVALSLSACGNTVAGTPTAMSIGPSSSTPRTQVTLSGVSPPTTAAPNDNVTGTTFDGCASVTDAEIASWELKPETKHDTKGQPQARNVRGCLWNGKQWYLRIYAVNGSITQWDKPQEDNDRQEAITIGSRSGWLLHSKDQITCTIALPSQQGIATVQVNLNLELTDQRYDQCPLAKQIMTTIEPRIP